MAFGAGFYGYKSLLAKVRGLFLRDLKLVD